jgi:4-carboxymuconolactone decarboxylase
MAPASGAISANAVSEPVESSFRFASRVFEDWLSKRPRVVAHHMRGWTRDRRALASLASLRFDPGCFSRRLLTMKELPGRYQQFKQEFPKISQAYDAIGRLTAESGPLDEKLVQLIKLGMAVASSQEGAVHSHTRRASEAGATREEIRQVALLALTTVGFPRMMAGLTWIDDVLKGIAPRNRGARTARTK